MSQLLDSKQTENKGSSNKKRKDVQSEGEEISAKMMMDFFDDSVEEFIDDDTYIYTDMVRPSKRIATTLSKEEATASVTRGRTLSTRLGCSIMQAEKNVCMMMSHCEWMRKCLKEFREWKGTDSDVFVRAICSFFSQTSIPHIFDFARDVFEVLSEFEDREDLKKPFTCFEDFISRSITGRPRLCFRYAIQNRGMFFFSNRVSNCGFLALDTSIGRRNREAVNYDHDQQNDEAMARRLKEENANPEIVYIFPMLFVYRPWVIRIALETAFDATIHGKLKYPTPLRLFDMCEPFLDSFLSRELITGMIRTGFIYQLVQKDISHRSITMAMYFNKSGDDSYYESALRTSKMYRQTQIMRLYEIRDRLYVVIPNETKAVKPNSTELKAINCSCVHIIIDYIC